MTKVLHIWRLLAAAFFIGTCKGQSSTGGVKMDAAGRVMMNYHPVDTTHVPARQTYWNERVGRIEL